MRAFRESKIAQLLRTFDAARMERFGLFVHSPYFNTSDTIRAAYDALLLHHPDFDPQKCTLELLHKQVCGVKKKYDYFRINNILSDLYELALKFLFQISLDEQGELEQWHVLTRLREARLDKQFEQQLKRYEKVLSKNENDDFYHLYRMYYFNELIWYSSAHNPEDRFGYLEQQYATILNYVLIRIGRLASILSFEEYQSSIKFSMPFLDELLTFFRSDQVPEQPVIQIYRNALLLLRERKDEYFFALREWRDKHRGFLTQSDVNFATQFLTQHAIYVNYEQGRTELYQYLVEDEKALFEADSYKVQVVVPFASFISHLRIACIAQDFVWAKKYMDTYLHRVIPEEQENCREFALATIARAQGKKKDALKHIQRVNFRLAILAIQVRDITVMLQYELEDYEQCLYSLDTFRHYVKTLKDLPPRYVQAHQDFIRLTKKLIAVRTKVRSAARTKEVQELKKSIDGLEYNTFNIRRWLQEQISEFR